MDDIQDREDMDQLARNQAALAAQARAQQVAGSIATAHADNVYNQARRNAAGYAARFPNGRPSRWGIQPPPPPAGGIIPGIPVPPPPPPSALAVGAMNALTDVSTAMTSIVDTLTRRTGGNSRGRDGDVVIYKDISGVFDEVPEDILARVKYVKSIENRLQTHMSGIRVKSDSMISKSIRVTDDSTDQTNFRMYEFKNVDVIVPFAVVFSDAGKDSKVMLRDTDGYGCYVPVPTRIMNKLSAQVYSYLYDKIPQSMRMLHADCDKHDAFTLIHRIQTLEKQSLYTPLQVLKQRLSKITCPTLNDWNVYEPDMNEIINAFNEHESMSN